MLIGCSGLRSGLYLQYEKKNYYNIRFDYGLLFPCSAIIAG